MRTLYSDRQIGLIREAGKVLADCFAAIKSEIKPGMTAKQIEKIADDIIKKADGKPAFLGYKYGSQTKPFPSSICSSVNSVVVHGIPDDRPFVEGDLVSIDIGVRKNDYYADSAWTYGVGKVDDVAAKLLRVGEDALLAGIAAIKPQIRMIEVSQAIQEVVVTNGFSIVRDFVGHGVGLELHEAPQVRNYIDDSEDSKVMLKRGMVLAIEPMVAEKSHALDTDHENWVVKTHDGGRAVHFEHTVAITDNGPDILTK